MSKFNNPARALSAAPPAAVIASPPPPVAPITELPSSGTAPTVQVRGESRLIGAGFVLLCTMLVTGQANDIAFHVLGNKAYISTIASVLVPIVWLLSGNSLRGLKSNMGHWWLAFLGLMVVGIPFSVWRRGSMDEVLNYCFRSLPLYFYICAFTTTLRRCRALMYTTIAASFVLLLTCALYGSSFADTGDRFRIIGSIFSSNANDLAVQLLLAVTEFAFVFYTSGVFTRILGTAGILIAAYYIPKTESRGCMLAAVFLMGAFLILGRNRIVVGILAVLVLALGIAVMPKAAIARFAAIFSSAPTTEDEAAARASGLQREELFKKSLYYTVAHPILGVGPGQFAVALTGEANKKGEWAPWLGTHNSYTQVSSECGIPAFICYCVILGMCFRKNLRICRQAGQSGLREVEGLAFCLFCGTLVYAVATFFFHMAYGSLLPLLGGSTVALEAAAQPLLKTVPGDK